MKKTEKIRNTRKKLIIPAILSAFVIVILCLLQMGMDFKHKNSVWMSSVDKADISDIIKKEKLSEEDYHTILIQTGLTKAGVDSFIADKDYNGIKKIQQDFYAKKRLEPDYFAFFTCCDRTNMFANTVKLEDGDIIVTPSTHFSAWSVGHVAIVVNAQNGEILNATGYDCKSCVEDVTELTCRPCFMVLRPKLSKQERKKAAEYALNNLEGLSYSLSVGFFKNKFKQKADRTNCGHIVWYAYKKVGIDIDSNGGAMVMPSDILKSDKLQVLQIFGADPENYEF